jgi:hypothetical protein
VVIPGAFDVFAALFYNSNQLTKHVRVEALAECHGYIGIEPELGIVPSVPDMDVHGLKRIAFV